MIFADFQVTERKVMLTWKKKIIRLLKVLTVFVVVVFYPPPLPIQDD